MNNLKFLLLLLALTSCPKEPIWYSVFVRNPNNIGNLKIFVSQNNPGDSLLPVNEKDFKVNLEEFNVNYSTGFRVCKHAVRGLRDCIESQPEKKIYVYVFEVDTLAAYDYAVIRGGKKYKDRIEIPYTMATNDANLIIEYP